MNSDRAPVAVPIGHNPGVHVDSEVACQTVATCIEDANVVHVVGYAISDEHSPYQHYIDAIVEGGNLRMDAISSIRAFGFDVKNQVYLGSEASGLVPVLARAMAEFGNDQNAIMNIFMNLTCPYDNRPYIGSKSFGIINTCVKCLNRNIDIATAGSLLWNLSLHLANAEQAVDEGAVEVLTRLLIQSKMDNNVALRRNLLTPLMIISRHPRAGPIFMRIPMAYECVESLVDDSTLDGLRATFIVANVTGRMESCGNISLLVAKPNLSTLLVTIFQQLCSGRGGPGFTFMDWDLIGVVTTFLNLSATPSNRAVLVGHPELLPPLIGLLTRFVENGPPVFERGKTAESAIGGGGKDVEVAETVVHVLIQLASHYSHDNELQEKYMTADLELIDLLHKYAHLPENRLIHSSSRAAAMELRGRLLIQPPFAPTCPDSEAVSPHVESVSDFTRAWNIINDVDRVTDMEAMHALIDELGLKEADELRLCDAEDLNKMKNLLKKIPLKVFNGLKLS